MLCFKVCGYAESEVHIPAGDKFQRNLDTVGRSVLIFVVFYIYTKFFLFNKIKLIRE